VNFKPTLSKSYDTASQATLGHLDVLRVKGRVWTSGGKSLTSVRRCSRLPVTAQWACQVLDEMIGAGPM